MAGQEELSGEAQAHSVFEAQGVPGFTVDRNPWGWELVWFLLELDWECGNTSSLAAQ